MQITEDTPPDMLAGAMDLTLHLPSGKIVKMSVERSTPMMDLLVQITTVHHLQLSNHTLQVLGMAPTKEHSDKVLPFKPNTPIGTLDTQHIRVLPKRKIAPVPKCVAPGHQPFESTFRLKVHLPRNQLYVTRVGQNVLLDEIMRKVCEEKNLDPAKYDFKHPENLDEILDPKLTLSDYQITEIYVVHKNSINLNRAFSTADIMALRKEEERKHINNKTGGVFNLIFGHKRGKPSTVSGSISSDNRSISPSHSEDARSVTPPVVQHPPIVAPPKNDPPPDRPKPPQRKRRPAPKPPQIQVTEPVKEEEVKPVPVLPVEEPLNPASRKPSENGVTICHSRNSSDSSGYHEASILSEHCANASLPRARPKSAFVGDLTSHQGTSNLNSMAGHSRSTTSLVGGRKKKAAPPPPPAVPSPSVTPPSSVVAQPSQPSPVVVASQPDSTIQPGKTPSTPHNSPHVHVKTKKPNKLVKKRFFTIGKTIRTLRNAFRRKKGVSSPRGTTTLGRIYQDERVGSETVVIAEQGVCQLEIEEEFNSLSVEKEDLNTLRRKFAYSMLDLSQNDHPVTDLDTIIDESDPDFSAIQKDSNELNNASNWNSLSQDCNANNFKTNSCTSLVTIQNSKEVLSNKNAITRTFSMNDENMNSRIENYDFKPPVLEAYNITPAKGSRRRLASTRKLNKPVEVTLGHQIKEKCSSMKLKSSKRSIEVSPNRVMTKSPDDENWKQFISKLDRIIVSKSSEFI